MNKFFKFTIIIALTLSSRVSAEDGPQPLPEVSGPLQEKRILRPKQLQVQNEKIEIESDSQDKNLEKDEMNKLVSAAGMLLTAPIGLPIEFVDALQDVGLPVVSVLGYGGAKFGEILYNSAINAGKGIGWFFEGFGRSVVYLIHPDHPEVDLSRYDFKWEDIAGDFESYWRWAQDNSGNLVNTWMTQHAYSLVGAKIPEARYPYWGFLRVLTCEGSQEFPIDYYLRGFRGKFRREFTRLDYYLSSFSELICRDAEGTEYAVYGNGLFAAGVLMSYKEKLFLVILDLNPFGTLEGYYIETHAGIELGFGGGLVTAAVGEGGAKFILGAGSAKGFGIAGGWQFVEIEKL